MIKQYVDKLFVQLRKEAANNEPVDMLKWYNFTTFDIIGDLVFGEPFHCLDNSDYHPWIAMIFAGTLQLALALHVRNTLVQCAVEGARYGARADVDPGAAVGRVDYSW